MAQRVLLAINFDEGLYNFRKELLEALLKAHYEVHLAVPAGEFSGRLQEMGCILHDTALNRRGKNPLQELSLIGCYGRILEKVKPDVVLTYTIKPNIYLGFLCSRKKIPYITTITGLGTAVEGRGILQSFTRWLYRGAMKKVKLLFFQNETNEKLFARLGIAPDRHRMLPGSGVNLQHFAYQPFPQKQTTDFLFISRIMKEKGIEEYLDAAEAIKREYPDTCFKILGFLEDDYRGRERFERLQKEGIICFEGSVSDVIPYIRDSQCTVHPSFYPEGMSNVCLESAACGRAVITTDRPGCRETIQDGISGFLIRERDSQDLLVKLRQFLALPIQARRQLGENGRKYMEERFDRRIVVQSYLEAVAEVINHTMEEKKR